MFMGQFCLAAVFLTLLTVVIVQARVMARKKKEISDMRDEMLLSQISRHFICNTLTTIRYLCKTDARLAAEAVDAFAGYLRGNLDSLTGDKVIAFSKELDHVKNYLAIEQKRFGKRLRLIYDIRETDFMLPSLTLQPIVENAVKHGVTKRESGGTIRIATGKSASDYWIRVEDDGVGFCLSEKRKGKAPHIGIDNAASRLASLCGGTITVESSQGEGTKALIRIPRAKEDKR